MCPGERVHGMGCAKALAVGWVWVALDSGVAAVVEGLRGMFDRGLRVPDRDWSEYPNFRQKKGPRKGLNRLGYFTVSIYLSESNQCYYRLEYYPAIPESNSLE